MMSYIIFAERSLYDTVLPEHYARQNIARIPLFDFIHDPTYTFKSMTAVLVHDGVNIYGSSVDGGKTIVFMNVDKEMTKSDIILRDVSKPLGMTTEILVEDAWWPMFSPDGKWIYFSKEMLTSDNKKQFDIFRIKPDGTSMERLTFTETLHEEYPVFSRDGKTIAFVEKMKDKDGEPLVSAVTLRDTNMNEIKKIFAAQNITTPRYAFTKDGVNYWLMSATFSSPKELAEQWGIQTLDIWIVSEDLTHVRQLSAGVYAEYPIYIHSDETIAYMVETITGIYGERITGNLIYINGYNGIPVDPPRRLVNTAFSLRTPWVDYEQKWIYFSVNIY